MMLFGGSKDNSKEPQFPKNYKVNPNQIQFTGATIGVGAAAIVQKVNYRGRFAALKGYTGINASVNLENAVNEVNILSSLFSPHIVRFYGVITEKENDTLKIKTLMECVKGHDLHKVLADRKKKEFDDWSMKWKLALDAIHAIDYLHTREPVILHRDIKGSHFILTKDYELKLCSFEMSKVLVPLKKKEKDNEDLSHVGALLWKAPETYTTPYTTKSDIFSYGMLLYEIAARTVPFDYAVTNANASATILEGKRPDISGIVDVPFKELIEKCWAQDPAQRPTSAQIIMIIEEQLAIIEKNKV